MSTRLRNLLLGLAVTLILISTSFALLQKSAPVEVSPQAEPSAPPEVSTSSLPVSPQKIIGASVAGRAIESYTFGTGDKTVLMVGGIHGGYEWNSILLAYEFIDALEAGTLPIPQSLRVVIVPNLNPDGLFAATGLVGRFARTDITDNGMHQTGVGRFNQNAVDLNRNFDCKWQSKSSWRSKVVSAGSAPFSEPESAALKKLVEETEPIAALFWHSQANAVYASECEAGVLPATLAIMNLYATAGNYDAVPVFTAYPITGDAEGWLASLNIPAITIELQSRTDTEWPRNLKGVTAVLEYLQ